MLPMFKKLILSHHWRRRVSWTIALVLIFPFILFFHASGRLPGTGPGGAAGRLFGKPVPWERFEQHRFWVRRAVAGLGEEQIRLSDETIMQMTWDRLLLIEEAARRGLRVTPAELAAFIRRIPAFQDKQHQFVAAYYLEYVRNSGFSPQQFEVMLKDDLLIGKLQESVQESRSDAWLAELRLRAGLQNLVGAPAGGQ